MKCKHRDKDTFRRIVLSDPVNVWMECDVCATCGAWLSLGESNDDDERVKIEMRAALLAIDKNADETTWAPEEIGGGYVAACWKPGAPFSDVLDNDEQLAGYLGWIIEHHDSEES